jgi:hypothetical protein
MKSPNRWCSAERCLVFGLLLLWLGACGSSEGSNPGGFGGSSGSSGSASGSGGSSGSAGGSGSNSSGASNGSSGSSGSGASGSSSGSRASSSSGSSGASSSSGGSSGSGSGSSGSSGGSGGDGGACPHVQMKGTDICTIGDSWIQIPGNQVTTLEDHMHMAGVIPATDHFDRREVSGSTLSSIIGTYNNKPMNCKILVMDGGGIDLFNTAAGDQAAIAPVVQKFRDFLQKVKTDGFVQHIIYSLYPVIPSTPNLNVNMKPGFSAACAASVVDCHLVDLEPLFQGQHFGSDRTHPDNAGGVIIGDAWWKAMQNNCIAQ